MSSNPSRSALLDTWTETSSHVFNSFVEANRAAFAVLGVDSDDNGGGDSVSPRERIEPDEDLAEWSVEKSEDHRESLGVGDRVEFTKTITEDDVTAFAAASGDTNPLHLDEEYAAETRFRGRIVHGTLVGSLISAALARLPGLIVYLSQDTSYLGPVDVDERVTAVCEVVEDLGSDRYRLTTSVRDGDGTEVIDGEAVVIADPIPDTA